MSDKKHVLLSAHNTSPYGTPIRLSSFSITNENFLFITAALAVDLDSLLLSFALEPVAQVQRSGYTQHTPFYTLLISPEALPRTLATPLRTTKKTKLLSAVRTIDVRASGEYPGCRNRVGLPPCRGLFFLSSLHYR